MLLFETILGLLLGATLLSALARRANIPYPALLALGGALLAFIPGAPRFDLPPDLILALFVAPVLLDAAYDSSLRDLRDNWRPVSSLVLVAVGLTTVAVALAVRQLVPGMPWPPSPSARCSHRPTRSPRLPLCGNWRHPTASGRCSKAKAC